MDLRVLGDAHKLEYDLMVTHIMQSWNWGEFRKSVGTNIERYGIYKNDKLVKAFQISFHEVPVIKKYVGYLPKGPFPDSDLALALKQIAVERNCIFIKTEPDIQIGNGEKIDKHFRKAIKSLFTKYNFVLDLSPSEEELLKNMHQKTRYNIKVAVKKGVVVTIDDSEKSLRDYLKLYFETTKRQGYFGHNENYHTKVYETFLKTNQVKFAIARYKNTPLTAWMLLIFKDKLYYPYGGSSHLHRDTMSSNLVAWEAIKLGKSLGLRYFDMWGALGPDADPKDSWYGFHKFKMGYGGELQEYIGSFDLVAQAPLYYAFNSVDKFTKVKVAVLRALGR